MPNPTQQLSLPERMDNTGVSETDSGKNDPGTNGSGMSDSSLDESVGAQLSDPGAEGVEQLADESAEKSLLASVSPDDLPDITESMRLLERAQGGDDEALNALLSRYEDRLKRIVRIRLSARLRRCVETVDIVQETFQSALKHIGSLEMRSTASIMQWLSRIAENQMHDIHRRFYGQKRDRTREVRISDGGRMDDDSTKGVVPPSSTVPPDELAAQDEIRKIVDDAVAELPDDYREVIMLRTYYGGSWEFVAQQIGRPNADAARQLHRRARIRLSRIMQGRLPEGGV